MTLTDESLMPFGCHSDKKMQDVPAQYLDWLHGAIGKQQDKRERLSEPEAAVLKYIETNRTAIDQDLKKAGII